LTRKEQILELISEGLTTDEIAEKLKISPNSVKWYRKELLKQYKAFNMAHLVRIWMEERTLCVGCKKEPATLGLGNTKTVCSKCWNSMFKD
jgi:DNA-binding CsgD family transcriptional regulator